MSLRFTDTNKWEDDWFLALSPLHKLIHGYLYDKCDVAGVWKIGMTDLQFRTGATEQDWHGYLQAAGTTRVIKVGDMKHVWLLEFIPDQNPRGLTPRNPTVSGIVRSLAKVQAPIERLPTPYQAPLKSFIVNNEQGAMKGLVSPQGIGQGKGVGEVKESPENHQEESDSDIPTETEFARFCGQPTCCIRPEDAKQLYAKMKGRGWKDATGQPIADWRWYARAQKKFIDQDRTNAPRNGNGQSARPLSDFAIKERISAIKQELRSVTTEADIPRGRELNAELERLQKSRTGLQP